MTARELESALLARCSAVALAQESSAHDQREANVFRVAGVIMRSKFPGEANRLLQASERYFANHPVEQIPPADVVRNGWVLSLPRLRDMLSHRWQGS